MLPWIFAILVLLNVGLFVWGYQREKSLEPPATPVPEGKYAIRLVGESPQEPAAFGKGDDHDPQAQDAAKEQATTAEPLDDETLQLVPDADADAEQGALGPPESDAATSGALSEESPREAVFEGAVEPAEVERTAVSVKTGDDSNPNDVQRIETEAIGATGLAPNGPPGHRQVVPDGEKPKAEVPENRIEEDRIRPSETAGVEEGGATAEEPPSVGN